MSAFKMLTVNWPIPVSVYCSKISHSTSVISKHHILLTKTLKTLTPASINTSHLHCCMPVVSGNILTSKLICLEDFELSLRRNFIFWLEALSLISRRGSCFGSVLGSEHVISLWSRCEYNCRFDEEGRQPTAMITTDSSDRAREIQIVRQ